MATIIIKRKSSIIGCLQSHNVYNGDTFVGELKNGETIIIPVEIGTHMLSFISTIKRLGQNTTFVVVINKPDEVVEIKAKFGTDGYTVKYADNKVHLPRQPIKITSETEKHNVEYSVSPHKSIVSNEEKSFSNNFDDLDGSEFENWCATLLKNNGFVNVEITKASGDQGVDILAQKNDIKYAIQCKCYSSDLGNSPIQEVHAGKSMYNCHVGVVMTNRHFTNGAKELAKATGVLLWDREKLLQMTSNIESAVSYCSHNDIDPQFKQALDIAVEMGKISTSLLQRRLEIGYGRAAKIIDKMEALGYVSAPDGSKPRQVLVSKADIMNED